MYVVALSFIHLIDAKTGSKRAFCAFLGFFETWILHPPSAKTPFSFLKCSKPAFRALFKFRKARNARFERFLDLEMLQMRVSSLFLTWRCSSVRFEPSFSLEELQKKTIAKWWRKGVGKIYFTWEAVQRNASVEITYGMIVFGAVQGVLNGVPSPRFTLKERTLKTRDLTISQHMLHESKPPKKKKTFKKSLHRYLKPDEQLELQKKIANENSKSNSGTERPPPKSSDVGKNNHASKFKTSNVCQQWNWIDPHRRKLHKWKSNIRFQVSKEWRTRITMRKYIQIQARTLKLKNRKAKLKDWMSVIELHNRKPKAQTLKPKQDRQVFCNIPT